LIPTTKIGLLKEKKTGISNLQYSTPR